MYVLSRIRRILDVLISTPLNNLSNIQFCKYIDIQEQSMYYVYEFNFMGHRE